MLDTDERPDGAVVEVAPGRVDYEPVTDADVIKIINEESVPIGAMLCHLIKAATPADRNYIDAVIADTEANLSALRTIRQVLADKFDGKVVTASKQEPKSEVQPRVKRTYKRRPTAVPSEATVSVPPSVPAPTVDVVPDGADDEDDPELAKILSEYDTSKKRYPDKPVAQAAPRANTPATTEAGMKNASLARANLVDERRVKVAHFLRDGPKWPMVIAKAVGIPTGSITGVLLSPWFVRSDQGVHLTPEGRRATDDD